MSYKIKYTQTAAKELDNIYSYISEVLLEPNIAKKYLKLILKEIKSLSEMPNRFRLYEKEPWKSKGLRIMPIKNYLVFYITDEENQTVYIVRIMYGGRNIESQLNETDI